MTLEVLLKMRPVFEALRGEMAAGDPLLRDLIDKIPNEFQFLIYEELTPVLLQIRQESDRLSGDKYPTSPEVCPSLYRIHSKIDAAEDRIDLLIGDLNDETDKSFPVVGIRQVLPERVAGSTEEETPVHGLRPLCVCRSSSSSSVPQRSCAEPPRTDGPNHRQAHHGSPQYG